MLAMLREGAFERSARRGARDEDLLAKLVVGDFEEGEEGVACTCTLDGITCITASRGQRY